MLTTLLRLFGAISFLGCIAVSAADFDSELTTIQNEWAVIKYQKPAKEQTAAFEELLQKTGAFRQNFQQRAEPLIWDAIVRSSYAGAKGGFGALSLVREARTELEQAIHIDPQALAGSAYTSLGSLYYKVPGWPIGFGNNKKAQDYLQQALQINPNGIDPNFFYGELMLETGKIDDAIAALEKALAAPDRPGRHLADEGRRDEIRKLLADARRQKE